MNNILQWWGSLNKSKKDGNEKYIYFFINKSSFAIFNFGDKFITISNLILITLQEKF